MVDSYSVCMSWLLVIVTLVFLSLFFILALGTCTCVLKINFVNIENGKFFMKLFDKRDAFPFKTVRIPDKRSNIPSKIFNSSIGAEVLRIARTSSNFDSFYTSCRALIQFMLMQGACKAGIRSVIKKLHGRHDILKSFEHNSTLFINQLVWFEICT